MGELVMQNGPQYLHVFVEHGCVPAVFHRLNCRNACFNNHHHLLSERVNVNPVGDARDTVLHLSSNERIVG
jgi:hypothetical protein